MNNKDIVCLKDIQIQCITIFAYIINELKPQNNRQKRVMSSCALDSSLAVPGAGRSSWVGAQESRSGAVLGGHFGEVLANMELVGAGQRRVCHPSMP